MTRPNRRGPWLPDEDETLMQLVCSQGPNNWVRISQHMQYRSPKQCRERYHQNLKPSLNHEPISSQEGELIEQMVNEMGKRWAEIARRLRNRSDNAVKNWWNGSMNRRKRNVIQHGHAMKGVGSRLQPIPAPKPLKNAIDRADRRCYQPGGDHQHEQHWAEPVSQESQCWRHMVSPTCRPTVLPGSVAQPARRQNPLPDPFPPVSALSKYPNHNPTLCYSRHLPSLNNIRPSEPLPNPPQAQSLRQTVENAPRLPQHSPEHRFGPSSLLLVSPRSHEPALISPAATEVSQASSLDRAPSLVFDNQSNCSISPKTVPSPRPDMLAPIDTDVQAWARELFDRRDSAPNILSHSKSQGKVHTDEGYVSALPQSAVSDSKSFLPPPGQGLYRIESIEYYRPGPHAPPYVPGASFSVPAESATTPGAGVGAGSKDARMDLSNLLG